MSGHGNWSPLRLIDEPGRNFLQDAFEDGNRNNIFSQVSTQDVHLSAYANEPERARALLGKLASRLKIQYWQIPLESNANEHIPAGYTYFGQLMAHDLVQHVTPFPALRSRATPLSMESDNLRERGLILDAIYGGGPRSNPSSYAWRSDSQRDRVHLRLGRVRKPGVDTVPTSEDPFRDIPRVVCPFMNHDAAGYADTLLVDPRNDDNVIVSQMTMLFHTLHNWVYDRISALIDEDDGLEPLKVEYRRFTAARKVVALVYRRIIVHDFLGRLLHPEVARLFDAVSFECAEPGLDYQNRGQDITVEFSHAAFRFGHAMIRSQYQLNGDLEAKESYILALLNRTSAKGAIHVPLESNWTVEWQRFFDFDLPGVQPSNRIAPSFRESFFVANAFTPPDQNDVFLPHLDFFRAAQAGVRNVKTLIASLPAPLRAHSAILSYPQGTGDEISRWLDKVDAIQPPKQENRLDSDERKLAMQDPPLLLFLLLEAAVTGPADMQGKRLGILGSAIVADSIYRVLRRGRPAIEGDAAVAALAERVFSHEVPADMPSLISNLPGLRPEQSG